MCACVKIEMEGGKYPLPEGCGVVAEKKAPALLWKGVGLDCGVRGWGGVGTAEWPWEGEEELSGRCGFV